MPHLPKWGGLICASLALENLIGFEDFSYAGRIIADDEDFLYRCSETRDELDAVGSWGTDSDSKRATGSAVRNIDATRDDRSDILVFGEIL